MKARKFMLLIAAALIAVVTLVVTGTSSARPAASTASTASPAASSAATQAPYKVALVTDVGGLDDRSFNFLANKGLNQAKTKLGVQGRVFISKTGSRLHPEPVHCGTAGLQPDHRRRVPDGRRRSRRSPRRSRTRSSRSSTTSGIAKELKGNPTNVRGLLFREQEAGYLVGYLAAKQITAKPFGGNIMLGAVGGLKIPPVDRFIAGYYEGAKKANPKVKVVHAYSQDFVDQAKCKEQALNMIANGAGAVFQVAGQCGLGVLSAAKERGVFGIGVDADQGYLGQHVMTSATKKVDVAVYGTIAAGEEARCEAAHQPRRDLQRQERWRRLRQDLEPDLARAEGSRSQRFRSRSSAARSSCGRRRPRRPPASR